MKTQYAQLKHFVRLMALCKDYDAARTLYNEYRNFLRHMEERDIITLEMHLYLAKKSDIIFEHHVKRVWIGYDKI